MSLLTLLAASCLASGSRADVNIDVFPGFDNLYRPDAWNPLIVRLSGTSGAASGQLQLLVRTREGATTYAQPVQLHAGTLNEYHTLHYFHPSPESSPALEMVVRLLVNGRQIAEKGVEGMLPFGDGQVAIVALTQDQSGLTFLNRLDLGYQHAGAANRSGRPSMMPSPNWPPPSTLAPGRNPMRVLYPRSETLPDSSYDYSGVDAIVLGDLPLDLLTGAQWDAIVDWVKDGGALVVSGGADINRARSKQLADILPIVPTGVKQVKALPALGDRYGVAPRLYGQGVPRPAPARAASSATAVMDGTLKSDALAVCRQGSLPLVSLRRLGNGVVFFTAFDMMAPEFRAWAGQPRLWGEILRLSASDLRVGEAVKLANHASADASRQMADALAGAQSTQAPSFTFIGLFLLAYILCLVPVNYYLLKRRDKKELAWITAPIIILLFSTGAYAVGRAIKGGQLFLRYGAVIEGAVNADGWAVYTIAGIFSPSQTRYDLSIADPAALPTELTQGASRFQRASSDLTVERSQKTVVQDALVNMWDHRIFDFESHVKLGGTIAASVLPGGSDSVEVMVTNNTPFTLTNCVVSYQSSSAQMGTLTPSQTQTVSVLVGHPRVSGNGLSIPYPGGSDNNSSTLRIQQALAASAASNAGGAEGNSPLIFTGWFTDPVVGLALENEQPRVEGVNLLVAHLPMPVGGSAPPPVSFQPPAARPDPFAGARPGMRSGFPPVANQNNAQQLNGLAYTYANQGNLDLALKTAQQAWNLAPQDGNIADTVAEMHQRRGEYDAAAKLYEQALQLQSGGGVTETHEKYGETLLALGRKAEAITQLQIAANDNLGAWSEKARQQLRNLGLQQ